MDNKLKILEDILYSHETRFDKDVVNFLLKNIPVESLLEIRLVDRKLGTTQNFEYQTNFFGKVLLWHEKIGDRNDVVNEWKNILNEFYPKYLETTFSLKCLGLPKNKDVESICNLDTIKALTKLSNYFENPNDYKCVNRGVILQELLCDKAENFFMMHTPTKNQSANIVKLINEQRDAVSEKNLTKNTTFILRTLESDTLKKLIYTQSSNIFKKVISENEIGEILNHCMTEKVENGVVILSSVINEFSSDKWIDSYLKSYNDELNILKLLKKPFFRSYGINITETFNPIIGKRTPETGHIWSEGKWNRFIKVFEHLVGGIKKEQTTSVEIGELYNSLMRTNDFKAVNILNKQFPFEELLASLDDGILKKRLNQKLEQDQLPKTIKYNEDIVVPRNWNEWLMATRKESLENELSNNQETPKTNKFKV